MCLCVCVRARLPATLISKSSDLTSGRVHQYTMRMKSCRRAPATLEVQVTVTLSLLPQSVLNLDQSYIRTYKIAHTVTLLLYNTFSEVTRSYVYKYVRRFESTHQHSEREYVQTPQAQYSQVYTHVHIRTCMYVCMHTLWPRWGGDGESRRRG